MTLNLSVQNNVLKSAAVFILTSMNDVLLVGFLIGMRHAVEADHVAAVATLATRNTSLDYAVKQGMAWGVGHTLTLFFFGSAVLLLDTLIPARLVEGLEFFVGIMLVFLGLDVIYRMARKRIPFYIPIQDTLAQSNTHSHHDQRINPNDSPYEQVKSFPLRALLVGTMHGMAGSAALILLTLGNVQSLEQGLFYILLFGIGSIVGMALLAAIISIPLRYSAVLHTTAHKTLKGLVAISTIGLGLYIAHETGFVTAF